MRRSPPRRQPTRPKCRRAGAAAGSDFVHLSVLRADGFDDPSVTVERPVEIL